MADAAIRHVDLLPQEEDLRGRLGGFRPPAPEEGPPKDLPVQQQERQDKTLRPRASSPNTDTASPGTTLEGQQPRGPGHWRSSQPPRRQGPPYGITPPHGLMCRMRRSPCGPFTSAEYIVMPMPLVMGSTLSTVYPLR